MQDAPKQKAGEFFNELAYMASVGPEIEVLVGARTHSLADYAEKASARDELGRGRPHMSEEDESALVLLAKAASEACDEACSASNKLFARLEACLSEGGDKERFARLALRIHGLKLRRVASTPPHSLPGVAKVYVGRSRENALVATEPNPYLRHIKTHQLGRSPYNFDLWRSGRSQSGLSLTPIKPETSQG